MRGFRVVFWLGLAPLVACDCSSNTPPIRRCEVTSDCPAGFTCVDNLCVESSDSGPIDARVDGMLACRDLDRDGHDEMSASCPDGTDCDDTRGTIYPAADELCGDGFDNDCDGDTDESDCECTTGQRIACYTFDRDTRGVGACRNGIAVCTGPGMVGPCEGEAGPGDETCDGTDEDCDGLTDEGLRNACGECSDVEPMEMCGNDIDDDCDGMADEDCDCDYRCMCAVGTSCECTPPTNQPCYEGPFGTEGRGVCAGGRRDCLEDAVSGETRWGMCVGEVLPSSDCVDGAADGLDNDCDGVVDEGCRDADGDGVPWPTDCDDDDAAIFPGATETCNGRDDNCDGIPDEGVTNGCGGCYTPDPTDECGNGLDDDCDGTVDNGCDCTDGTTQACYGGPPGTAGVGSCVQGTQSCEAGEFGGWGPCEGMVGPSPELCDGDDDDCDGNVDERWAVGSNACGWCNPREVCDGEDQDCDGRVDEGVSNRCGECGPEPTETCNGSDDDCDGIVDEGVVNACGTCPPEPCFTETWDTPADCDPMAGTDCDGVEPHPMFPDSVTLGQSAFDNDFIYIAVTQRGQVAKINTDTGVKEWQVTSHGVTPSRTAVAIDGSVWVANRAIGGNPNDVNQSNVVHLRESDGSLICRAPVIGLARGLAIDGDGNVWAGTWNGQTVWKISGSMVDMTTSPPTCVVLDSFSVGTAIYGLAADPAGYIWTSSSPNTVRIDWTTSARMNVANPSHYGIAADGTGRLWLGGWIGSSVVHSINTTTFAITNTSVSQVTAVTVHPDGNIWGSSYGTNEVVKINPATGARACASPTINGTNPHGVAVDRLGRIWSPNRYGGYVNVYDPDTCTRLFSYVVDAGQELYSYSDMTGHLLRTFIAPEGYWTQDFDSGYAASYWSSVEWDSDEPPMTGVEMSIRVAATQAGLDTAMPCGPFGSSPADLSTCVPALGAARWLRATARLYRSGGTTNRPILHEVRASWAY